MSSGAPSHRLVIDRFEGDFAVIELEGGTVIDVPRWLLPAGASEGDVIIVQPPESDSADTVTLRVDPDATAASRELARERLRRLRAGDSGGDIVL